MPAAATGVGLPLRLLALGAIVGLGTGGALSFGVEPARPEVGGPLLAAGAVCLIATLAVRLWRRRQGSRESER